jgi:hypothetical protein
VAARLRTDLAGFSLRNAARTAQASSSTGERIPPVLALVAQTAAAGAVARTAILVTAHMTRRAFQTANRAVGANLAAQTACLICRPLKAVHSVSLSNAAPGATVFWFAVGHVHGATAALLAMVEWRAACLAPPAGAGTSSETRAVHTSPAGLQQPSGQLFGPHAGPASRPASWVTLPSSRAESAIELSPPSNAPASSASL